MEEKERDTLQIKNKFQALVDNVRVFWAEVQSALTVSVLEENRRQVLESTSKRLEELTTQLSGYVLHDFLQNDIDRLCCRLQKKVCAYTLRKTGHADDSQ